MAACIPTMVIYGLVDPSTGYLRYIGQTTKTAEQRLKTHLANARYGRKTHCYDWIRQLRLRCERPVLWVIQGGITIKTELDLAERAWIAYFRDVLNFPLTNHTDGGEGGSLDQLTRQKISASKKGRKATLTQREVRSKMSMGSGNHFFGKRHTKEALVKMSESHKGGRNQNTGKTSCKRGHKFTIENTYIKRNGKGQDCRTCRQIRRRKVR